LGKYDDAITHFDKVLAIDPNYASALYNKGFTLSNLGMNEEAISYFDKALGLEPNYVDALNGKGIALYRLGNSSEAITYYDKALEVDPNHVDAINNKGRALYNLGLYDDAITYYDRAIAIDPGYTLALDNKVLALLDLDRFQEALDVFDEILAMDPNNIDALDGKGAALENLGNYEEAIVYFDKALAIDPNYTSALTNKGAALYNLVRSEEAIGYFDKALAIDPNYEFAINNKRLVLDAISDQNITSTSEPSLNNNQTDSSNSTSVINTIDNNTANASFLTYQNSTFGITVQYPSDWIYVGHNTILDPLSQPVVTFSPMEPSDTTLARIWITPLPVVGEEQKASLDQIAERTIELDQQTLQDFKLNESGPITLKDGTAAHMHSYSYTDPDFGRTDALDILMIKSNNLYAIEYFAEPQMYPIHLPKFQTMLDSLETTLLRSLNSIING
jgi:tetratricopeptide (TPR) repeat protein